MRGRRHKLNLALIILLILQISSILYLISNESENPNENDSLNSLYSIKIERKNSFSYLNINSNDLKSANYWNLTGSPIFINGSSEWNSTAFGEDWCSGNGSLNNPYIIENVIIDGQNSENCIEIRNSNVYFIIRNCILNNAKWEALRAGIYLYNVMNGKIINNTCSNSDSGICLFYGDYINITENFLLDNGYSGIELESFNDHNIISNNIAINNNQHGIRVKGDSDFNTITENIVEGHIYSGILIQGGSNNNNVSRNTAINNNPLWGIWIYNSDFNTIEDNLVSNNGQHGIYIEESNNNNIVDNKITDNGGNGIHFYSWSEDHCENNLIKSNKVTGNLGHSVYVDSYCINNEIFFNAIVDNDYPVRDDGINNTWDNGTIGNYWSDYNGVDANDDGIGDIPYIISGSSSSQDNFPIWDNKPPKSNIFYIPYNSTNTVVKSTYFTLFADDGIGSGISVIRYKINDSIWFNYTGPFTLSKYQYGDTLISFHSIDNKGNVENPNSILVNLIKLPDNPIIPSFDIFILSCIFCLISVITINIHLRNKTLSRN